MGVTDVFNIDGLMPCFGAQHHLGSLQTLAASNLVSGLLKDITHVGQLVDGLNEFLDSECLHAMVHRLAGFHGIAIEAHVIQVVQNVVQLRVDSQGRVFVKKRGRISAKRSVFGEIVDNFLLGHVLSGVWMYLPFDHL